MSFFASNDRVWVTAENGATVFDTNNRMPHFVSTVTNSLSVTFPAAKFISGVGFGRGGYRVTVEWPVWSQDTYLGPAPTNLSLFGYMNIQANCTHRSKMQMPNTFLSADNENLAGVSYIDTGNYGGFQFSPCEGEIRRAYSTKFVLSISYMRSIELVFYSGGVYLRARQVGGQRTYTHNELDYLDNTGLTIQQTCEQSYTSYNFTITANIGVVP